MSKRIKDTDHLVISARVKAMENQLLTREQLEQILEAKSDEEAVKLLEEHGYPPLSIRDPEALDEALSAVREGVLTDLADGAPDIRYIDIFRSKYDYHNLKAVLKAEAMGADPSAMMMDMGRVPAEDVREAVRTGNYDALSPILAAAAAEAREVLDTTRDPQLSDIVLDRWYYKDLSALAEDTGSAFLQGYVMAQIDAADLRILVRTLRMGKGPEFLQGVLFEGGSIAPESILAVSAGRGAGLMELYAPTRFAAAAEAGAEALKSGALTAFEKLCDDAVSDYLAGAQYVAFGEAPLVAYLAARETEYVDLRILLMGRGAGLPADVIRSRLRASYV